MLFTSRHERKQNHNSKAYSHRKLHLRGPTPAEVSSDLKDVDG